MLFHEYFHGDSGRGLGASHQTGWTALAILHIEDLAARRGLGHVALDGTKVLANASKHKAMSYGRMAEAERKLEAEVAALLAQAQAVDAAEDARYGKGTRGDELPAELARRESRLAKIRAAKAALEAAARAQAAEAAAAAQAKRAERERRRDHGPQADGPPPCIPDPTQAQPKPKAQRNFTDPESRIMKDGATKGFVQAYNAQAGVDSHAQVIVAAAVTQEANDKRQLVPMLTQVAANCGAAPAVASADSGYFSEAAVTDGALAGIDLYVAVERQKHGETPSTPVPEDGTVLGALRAKVASTAGRAVYALRKMIVEPVFGQIKAGPQAFRRFSFRGLGKVQAEWLLICLTHNLLKLFRAGWTPQTA